MPSKSTRGKQKTSVNSTAAAWEKLTWEDLDDWAGPRSVTRGKSYQQQGRVKELSVSETGVLLAWVQGTERYATRVELDTTKRKRSCRLLSQCSCPVGISCKHAVAVVVEFLQSIEDGREVAVADDDDPRWSVIEGDDDGYEDDDDDWGEYDDDDVPYRPAAPKSRTSRANTAAQRTRSGRRQKKITDADIRAYLESKPHDELVRLLMQISGRDGDVRKALADEAALAGGRFDELLHEARAEMRSLTAEDAWYNSWTGEGELPDYSGLEKRLKMLLDHGYADAIVTLGEELVQRGVEQVNRAHDEGETCCEIARCMQVVCEALLQSNRSDEDKILYAIDVLQSDGYGMCDDLGAVLDRRWKKSVWSAVADRLRERLDKLPLPSNDRSEWSNRHRRERFGDWVIDALDKAGRADEATQLCVDEAPRAASYTRAVRRLLTEQQFDQAEQLAREGLEATDPTYAGIIHGLQDLLSDIAGKKKDWKLPAAVAADRFFGHPSVGSYRDLLKAAKKAKCEPAVQQAALKFLQTGKRPDRAGKGRSKRKSSGSWPLPAPPQPQTEGARVHPAHARSGPHFDVLIDLAIAEKRPDDVLKWYDRQSTSDKNPSRPWLARTSRSDARIAKAVESTHPDRAIAIYRELADSIASETNTKTYPEAGGYLKRIKPLLKKAGREEEWAAILGKFRERHRRKPRLMQVIDGIAGRPIVKRKKR